MNDDVRPLGRHLRPMVDDARIARQYAVVARRLPRPMYAFGSFRFRSAPWSLVAGALVLALGLVFAFGRGHPRAPVPVPSLDGTVAESTSGRETLKLADGTTLELEAHTQVRLTTPRVTDVWFALTHGEATFDVAHVEGRIVGVQAGRYAVTVKGTRFTVRFDPAPSEAFWVRVERGRVEVAEEGRLLRVLAAGETLMFGGAADAGADEAAAPPAPLSTAPLAAAPPPDASAARGAAPPPGAAPSPVTAHDLLLRAQAARADGHPREAAALFDAIRLHHRQDPRAALAAFELGRIRLDELRDPKGAVAALDDCMALSPRGPLREDAEARRVEALESLGDAGRCAEARMAFVNRYPRGIHRSEVDHRCPSP